ncbi:DUF6892 domain-containing protein [Gulosibacter hominis]|uniref:DUF6892 domain-containing protein n=1 Tax=Gulosibacter hominis TaxID=2770504 RepID=UPI001919085E|nr:hypothetical protein [Gulosibacter hominis]
MEFVDFNVKLLVLEELIAEDIIDPPHATGHDWLMAARNIDWDTAEELLYGDLFEKLIPEAAEWARNIELTQEQLNTIEYLGFDGGNEIYGLLAPSWSGEDDLFIPETWVDVTPERFPNLNELVYVGDIEPEVRERLEAADVEIEEF